MPKIKEIKLQSQPVNGNLTGFELLISCTDVNPRGRRPLLKSCLGKKLLECRLGGILLKRSAPVHVYHKWASLFNSGKPGYAQNRRFGSGESGEIETMN
jgi:hypothetical protein